ncbi:MAG: hypothetical protein AAF600_04320 [Bacteroidota bacterium]
MKIQIKTKVRARLSDVKKGFTEKLFLKLNPPFPPVKLHKFDGCSKGDQVILELNFFLFKQKWISDITEDGQDNQRWYFVDQGTKLPFFLKSWKHHHEVRSVNDHTVIFDDITFSTGMFLTDLMMYPLLLGQFIYRKPIYKNVFSQK